MYKVFINEKLICFANENEIFVEKSNCLIISFFQVELIDSILELLKNDDKVDTVFIFNGNPKETFELFKTRFKLIVAAGGLVKNDQGNYLAIHRLGKWDLPKGKIESNESIKEGAIREIEEECGVDGLRIIKKLPETFHIYEHKEKTILKQTYWFEMKTSFSGDLTPQIEENITDVCWMTDEEMKQKVYSNTYASIKELLVSSL